MKSHITFRRCMGLMLVVLLPAVAHAQGTKADYERARGFRELVRGKVFKATIQPNWLEGAARFWYRNDLHEEREFILVDAEAGTRLPAFDHARLAAALSLAAGETYEAGRLPFDQIEFTDNQSAIRFAVEETEWSCRLDSYQCAKTGRKVEPRRGGRQGRRGRGRGRGRRGGRGQVRPLSPDGKWVASVRDHNLYLVSTETGEQFQLTTDGVADHFYSPNVAWAPNSKKVATNRVIPQQEHLVHYVESSPDEQVQPGYNARQYLKPGDRVTINRPKLFDVATKTQIDVDYALFDNPYRSGRIQWRQDSRAFTFDFNQRGHEVYRVIRVDAESGHVRAVVDEQPDTFFDYYHKLYKNELNDGREILWASERDGWNHLYLYDGDSGEVKNQITRGEWVVRGVDRVDEEARQIWFRASGVNPDQDPYYIHYYRINFDGTGMVALTEGDGTHSVQYSPDRDFLIDTYSRVDMAPVHTLRRTSDGSLVYELEKADVTDLLATGWRWPEPFSAKGRDGVTDIYGVIYRPINFDESKAYPVVEDIYAGPHDSFVPKAFSQGGSREALAELGFIVIKVDGMGTNNRSKAFHDVCWKNIIDAGFPDRILWMKAAAQKYPYMDLERVGIYGHSAGGQNTAAALFTHPEFYKVGVSSCGCHDNRMDKISWNEQWMGWPVGPEYAESSNVTHAHKLEGKLLLTVGELDTNVPPASTLQVVDALIKANKDFDFIVFPGAGHSTGGAYGTRRRWDFFVKHLLGVEPPNDHMNGAGPQG